MKNKLALLALISLTLLSSNFILAQKRPNVLFIAVDDLKPILACYGDKIIKTPNIDRIAKNGTLFAANYCQQAVCGPTRASLMTGKRPDYTKVWDLQTKMRDINPTIISIPQYFASQGYSTQGIGKVYDIRCVDKEFDKPSWTVPYYKTDNRFYSSQIGQPVLNFYQDPATKLLAQKYLQEAYDKGLKAEAANAEALLKIKPSTEGVDVPDNAYNDGANALQAKNILIELSKKNEPFFFAVGFSKPHLPFVSPKKYWDLYTRDSLPVAEFQEPSSNAVTMAYHNAGEIRSYTDIPPLTDFTDQKPGITLPLDKQRALIHGYYAAVSYTDAQIGIVLKTLDSLGLTDNTIIVLWGDHGWHLGDHNLWCKHSNFEQATHAPLLISAPGIAPSKVSSPSEFIDIFPTLCDLANLKMPSNLDGKSLVPAMKKPTSGTKKYAVSQYPRSGPNSESERLGYADSQYMGYSIRTNDYRYTLWMKDRFRSSQAFDKKLIVGVELFDYVKDPNETKNVVKDKAYKSTVTQMQNYIEEFFNSEYQKTKTKTQ